MSFQNLQSRLLTEPTRANVQRILHEMGSLPQEERDRMILFLTDPASPGPVLDAVARHPHAAVIARVGETIRRRAPLPDREATLPEGPIPVATSVAEESLERPMRIPSAVQDYPDRPVEHLTSQQAAALSLESDPERQEAMRRVSLREFSTVSRQPYRFQREGFRPKELEAHLEREIPRLAALRLQYAKLREQVNEACRQSAMSSDSRSSRASELVAKQDRAMAETTFGPMLAMEALRALGTAPAAGTLTNEELRGEMHRDQGILQHSLAAAGFAEAEVQEVVLATSRILGAAEENRLDLRRVEWQKDAAVEQLLAAFQRSFHTHATEQAEPEQATAYRGAMETFGSVQYLRSMEALATSELLQAHARPTPEAAGREASEVEAVLREAGGAELGRMDSAGELRVGRGEGMDVRLRDLQVSREHLLFIANGDRLIIRDQNSTNGTRVNGVAIPPGQTVTVPRGAELEIEVGESVLRMSGEVRSQKVQTSMEGMEEWNRLRERHLGLVSGPAPAAPQVSSAPQSPRPQEVVRPPSVR